MAFILDRRRRRAEAVARLREAVFDLSIPARESMLDGIDSQSIIVGRYTSIHGGVCPMLAAHRCGARADFHDFAKAWDGLAGARRPRPATVRELDVLRALLQEGVDRRSSPPQHDASGESAHEVTDTFTAGRA